MLGLVTPVLPGNGREIHKLVTELTRDFEFLRTFELIMNSKDETHRAKGFAQQPNSVIEAECFRPREGTRVGAGRSELNR